MPRFCVLLTALLVLGVMETNKYNESKEYYYYFVLMVAGMQIVNAQPRMGVWQKGTCEWYIVSDVDSVEFRDFQSICPDNQHPHAIDLGLQSGTKWGCCNIGARLPEEYGDYFAWGETEPKSYYSWSTYKWCDGSSSIMTKYNADDGKTELDPEDDAATANWGPVWRMPNEEQIKELLTPGNTQWIFTTYDGVHGLLIVSKRNSNSIFLPVAGSYIGTSLIDENKAWYSSSSLNMSRNVMVLYYNGRLILPIITVNGITSTSEARAYGLSVRPVFIEGNPLSLWSDKEAYKVGGSSCTLVGTIDCPTADFNAYGTYGILCDENQSNLTDGNAEYQGKGFQSDSDENFSIDLRGLKPRTTYYYRAYYKFNDTDHGGIVPAYGNSSDQVFYEKDINSFTTGDNILNVDVVMCIDVTGSMNDIISTVKNNAISFYDVFKNKCEDESILLESLSTQVIAFRDKNSDSNWLQTSSTFSLPSQSADFKSFVSGLYAMGGGDTPESGLEALQTAFNKTDWGADDGYHRQVVILWTDAPYLTGTYSNVELNSLATQWNAMPSGRRLILFAPYGTDGTNSGSWGNLDEWTNVMHETALSSGFNNFNYILESIIGELTGKAKVHKSKTSIQKNTYFRPNE